MLIKINFDSLIPIYQQLKDQIIIGIAKGDLEPNESLPSVRQLASDLDVNLHTIRKAYNQLKSEGYLTINRRKGARVSEMPNPLNESQRKTFEYDLKLSIAKGICSGLSAEEITNFVDKLINDMKGSE